MRFRRQDWWQEYLIATVDSEAGHDEVM